MMDLEPVGKLDYSFIERSARSKADHFTQITCIRISRKYIPACIGNIFLIAFLPSGVFERFNEYH